MPAAIKGQELSLPGYTVDVVWSQNAWAKSEAFGSGETRVQVNAGPLAHPILKYRGESVRTLNPIPVTRSTLNPRKPDGLGN